MPKKVIQIVNHFLPETTAGTEVYVWALAKQLQQVNIESPICMPHYNSDKCVVYHHDGLKVTCYAEPSVVNRALIMGKRKPDGLKVFTAYLISEQPDIVHFHQLAGSNGISLQHIIAAKSTGAKIIFTFHLSINSCINSHLLYKEKVVCDGIIKKNKCSACYLHSKTKSAFGKVVYFFAMAFYRLGINTTGWNNALGTSLGTGFIVSKFQDNFKGLIQHCDKVVALTNWYKIVLLLNGVPADKIAFVAQGLPFGKGYKQSENKSSANRRIRLVFVGRISYSKGLHILLQAVLSLPKDAIELAIYGKSYELSYEEEWRIKTQSTKHIYWKGQLLQQDVLATLQQYDAFCLCSTTSEMSPLVIQEANAAGIPTIASNVAGNAEQIKHDYNGLLFKFKDADSLKAQLVRCIEDVSLLPRLKKNIIPPRSFDKVAAEYVELYNTILS